MKRVLAALGIAVTLALAGCAQAAPQADPVETARVAIDAVFEEGMPLMLEQDTYDAFADGLAQDAIDTCDSPGPYVAGLGDEPDPLLVAAYEAAQAAVCE